MPDNLKLPLIRKKLGRTSPNSASIASAGVNRQSVKFVKSNDDYVRVEFDPRVSVKEISQRGGSATITTSSPSNPTYIIIDTNKPHQKLVSPPPKSTSSPQDEKLANLADELLKMDVNVKDKSPELVAPSSSSSNSTNKNQQYHWLIYPQEEMPNYIVEAKKRLRQIKEPNVAPNQQASSSSSPQTTTSSSPNSNSESAVSKKVTSAKIISNQKHWLNWEKPITPDNIKLIRKRLGDDRYRSFQKDGKSASQLDFRSKLEPITFQENSDINSMKITNSTEVVINNENSFINGEPYKIPDALSVLESANKVTVTYPSTTEEIITSTTSTNDFNDAIVQTRTQFLNVNENLFDQPPMTSVGAVLTNFNEIESSNKEDNRPPSNKPLKDNYTIRATENSTPVSLENWLQNADEQDKNAILRILRNIDGTNANSIAAQLPPTHPSSAKKLSISQRFNESRLSNTSLSSNKKTSNRKTASASSAKSQQQQQQQIFRPLTPQVRKLGTTRNQFYFPNENKEKELLHKYLWGEHNQSSVHYGYNF